MILTAGSVLLLLILIHGGTAVTSDDVKTLIDNILPTSGATPYYNSMRPLTNQDNAVEVTADLYMVGINDFDDAEQKLTTTAYLRVSWIDEVIITVKLATLDFYAFCHQLINVFKKFEPVHEISNNVICATSKASDQPPHMRSLIRAFASRFSIL